MSKKWEKKVAVIEGEMMAIDGQRRKLDERYIELEKQLKMAKNNGFIDTTNLEKL